MIPARLIRRVSLWWANRMAHAAMCRAIPELRQLDRLEASYRRDHRRGAAKIARAKKAAVCAALRAGRR